MTIKFGRFPQGFDWDPERDKNSQKKKDRRMISCFVEMRANRQTQKAWVNNDKLRGLPSEICKHNLIKRWNSYVEYDDQEEKQTTRENVKSFDRKCSTAPN
jgi:hypothetical protein